MADPPDDAFSRSKPPSTPEPLSERSALSDVAKMEAIFNRSLHTIIR